jgi:hypothetical protein
MTVVITNTPRAGESAEQTAARTAPRQPPVPSAKLAFLTEPSPGVFHLNLRVEGADFYRLAISRGQLGNIVVDGARMAIHPSPISEATLAGEAAARIAKRGAV